MAQIVQYPHYLHLVGGLESAQGSDGVWTTPEPPAPTLLSHCREETAGASTELRAGGAFYQFTSLIQLPVGAPTVVEGATVLVSDDPEGQSVRIRGTVRKFDRGQLHCRLWL